MKRKDFDAVKWERGMKVRVSTCENKLKVDEVNLYFRSVSTDTCDEHWNNVFSYKQIIAIIPATPKRRKK